MTGLKKIMKPKPRFQRLSTCTLHNLHAMKKIHTVLTAMMIAVFGIGLTAYASEEADVSSFLDQLELRSVASLPGGAMFSINDPANGRSFWLGLGERAHGLEAVAFDSQTRQLTVRFEGVEKQLSMRTSRVQQVTEPEPPQMTPQQRREEWQAMRERMVEFRGRWEAAAETSPEIREIENRMQALGTEMRDVMGRAMQAEQGSNQQRRLMQRGRELGEAFQALGEESRALVADNPAFLPEDVELMDNMRRMMPAPGANPAWGGGGGGRGAGGGAPGGGGQGGGGWRGR